VTRYTVKQLADVARISVRTLHHYDEIGLLEPAYVGDNGYRYYEPPQLYRLQQILLYRELGLSLSEIGGILTADDFEISAALRQHRVRLSQRLEQQQQLLRVIDDTLTRLNGGTGMDNSKLYEWHSPEKQAEYEAWLAERYGPHAEEWVATARKRTDSFTNDDKNAAMDRLATIEKDLVDAYNRGMSVGAPALGPLFDHHRQWVAHMWNRDCPPDAYAGLADLYSSHPDFEKRFEAMAPGFSNWLTAAMKAYAAQGDVSRG
jgi:MerR family transcriptional regulator, thiopeptide resistance regulator